MRYGSVCSGIEAATVAWHPLGWKAAWYSEIEPFPCAVLKHHYPAVPNYGDMTKYEEWPDEPINLLVGGTPCQSFSVAGLRKGLDDPRGNLMLTYGAIAKRYRPEWLVWENVPGVLSSNNGRDFGTFLGMLAELGYGFAYRVLDAQYFGVAQRRRRVFVVANARSWQRAAAVLFESHSLQGHPAPSRQTGEGSAAETSGSVELCGPLNARDYKDPGTNGMNYNSAKMVPIPYDFFQITAPVNRQSREPGDPCHTLARDNAAHATILQPVAIHPHVVGRSPTAGPQGKEYIDDGSAYCMDARGVPQSVAMNVYGGNKRQDRPEGGFYVKKEETSKTLDAATGLNPTCSQGGTAVMTAMQVRRLTPVECERLQGFPDGYTNIPWRKTAESPDGPRYKALGNSMAVPVMAWIGNRIKQVNEL